MNLDELLDELKTNILHDRSQKIAGDDDHLWSDETLVRYINEAQRRFARRSLIIRDGKTSDCCQIKLVTGQTEYECHSAVISVLSVRVTGDNADLPRAGHTALDTYTPTDTLYFDANDIAVTAPGRPMAWTTDETVSGDDFNSLGDVTLRIFPAPTVDWNNVVLNLRVCRTPLYDFDVDDLKAYPEIPVDYHLDMLDWAAYLALRSVDVDMGMADRAQQFSSSFEAHVKAAREEVMRKLFAPTAWGFGRNGFTYVR